MEKQLLNQAMNKLDGARRISDINLADCIELIRGANLLQAKALEELIKKVKER